MRKLINQFKNPIYKDDLLRVLGRGFIVTIIFSIFAGALQFFAYTYLQIGFGILVYLFAYMTAKKISDSFFNYHILYTLISIFYFIIGYFIYNITLYSFMGHNILFGFRYVFSYAGVMNTVLSFLNPNTYQNATSIFNNIMDILIFATGIFTAYILPRRKDK